MKQLLLFSILSILCFTISAQTNTWTGAGTNDNWNTVANWSLGSVPTAANDVVIPTGFTVDLNVAGTTKSITVQGNSTFNIATNLSFTNASSFAANTSVVWSSGTLDAGGTLTNNGTINMTTNATKNINGGSILNNNGTINMTGSFTLYIYSGSIVNLATGVIDIKALPNLAPYTTNAHSIINSGVIKKTTDAGTATISVALTNNGTIAVESGILNLSGETKTFNGGVYNVTAGNTLDLATNINLSNTMSGLVNGNLNWKSDLAVATTASFNFTGTSGINWTNGSLIGGGTLTNVSKMNMTTNSTKNIQDGSILSNSGTLNCLGSFTLYIYAGNLNNLSSGVIDIQALPNLAPYTSNSHSIVNSGLIKKTTDSGTATISVAMTNTGTISVQKGTLNLSGEAKTFNGGVYDVTAGNTLDLATDINLSNTMTGLVNGNLNWKSNMLVASAASFNFTGSSGLSWTNGSLLGGGTLTNTSKMDMSTNATKNIQSGSTLSNTGIINCTGSFVLYIYDGSLKNQTSGIIDIKALPNLAPYTSATHNIFNYGLIKKTVDTGTATISVAMTNTGTINVESGVLNLSGEAKTFDNGIYNVSSDAIMNLSTQIKCSGTFTGVLEGPMSWTDELNVAPGVTATLNFTGATGFNWTIGALNGGGTLSNTSELNLITNATKNIYGGTTLKNSGTLNCLDSFTLYNYDGILNNQPTGILNIQAEPNFAPYTTSAHSIINSGLIKRTVGTGTATISVALTNTGTIAVESGILNMSGEAKTFNGGTYNVSETGELNLSTQVICSGNLTGIATGPISWNNEINVVTANPATFNFTGASGINWTNGSLNGGGTLTNVGKMNLTTNATKNLMGGSTLSNSGELNSLGNFTLYIYSGILNNENSGVIDIQSLPTFSPYTSDPHSITNSGLIKKTSNTGVAQINLKLTNSGTIDSQMGTLKINGGPFTNTVDGIISGTASIDLPAVADYTNNGIFSPGGNPGTLTVIGDFKSSSTSELQIEMYGTTQGTEYDLLTIQGNAIMDGDINLALYFAPILNDEFVVVTANNITSCNLPSTVTQNHEGYIYTFNVICNSNNVTLKVTNIVLGIEENSLSNLSMFPNPSNGNFTIDLGKEYTDVSVQMYNMLGQIISSEKYASAKLIEKEITSAAGVYFVRVSTANEGSKTLRIIKQ